MRLFVAVYPPADALDDLAALVAGLAIGEPRPPGASLRLAPRERWHLTLAFLGDVAPRRVDAASAVVERAVDSWRTPGASPPAVWLAGGGRFGRGRFTTIWVGLRGELDGLGAIAGAIRRELRTAKLPFDGKPLHAHLTLARPADRLEPERLAADLATLDRYEGPKWTVDSVSLVRSELGPYPRHEPILTVPL